MISERMRRQLKSTDWDFTEHLPGIGKALHWYPGTFPADLPCTFIQALSKPNQIVFDPYGGIGTTAVEALRQGRKAWTVEPNPIGALVAYVAGSITLIKAYNPSYPPLLFEILRSLVLAAESGSIRGSYDFFEKSFGKDIDALLEKLISPSPSSFFDLLIGDPVWDALAEWLSGATLEKVKCLWEAIVTDEYGGSIGQLLGIVMVSSIIRTASSQTQSWGHIADNVRPKEFLNKNPFDLSLRWIKRTENMFKKMKVEPLSNNALRSKRYWVSNYAWGGGGKLSLKPTRKADLLVTSPPYAGAIDYTYAQRLSLYLLGINEDHVKALSLHEMGARRRRFSPGSRNVWAEKLGDAILEQEKYMSDSASMAFVLPHKDAGRDMGGDKIAEYLNQLSWDKSVDIDRSIRQARARQSWTSIKKETIQIYTKSKEG